MSADSTIAHTLRQIGIQNDIRNSYECYRSENRRKESIKNISDKVHKIREEIRLMKKKGSTDVARMERLRLILKNLNLTLARCRQK